LSTAPNIEEDAQVSPRKKQLTWVDSILPTISVILAVMALMVLAAPVILGFLVMLAVNQPQNLRTTPFLLLVFVLGVLLLLVLTARARNREIRGSYLVPPAIPLIAIFVLFAWANPARPEFPVNEQEFKAKLRDPQFVRSVVTPLTPPQERAIRSAIAEGMFSPEETEQFLNGFQRRFELDVAQSSHTSGESFLWIAQHGEVPSRRATAMNLAAPGYVLRVLLQDPNPDVQSLAQHEAAERLCDPEALRSIYRTKSDRMVKRNRPNYLATDPVLPQLMADNPCTPRDVLFAMSQDRPSISAPARAALAKKQLADQAISQLQ